jgi:thioesterase domain-containing protein/acyl carrier protein
MSRHEVAEVIQLFDQVGKKMYFPSTSSQRRFWFFDMLAPGNTTATINIRWEIRGEYDVDLIEQAFSMIIERHEILRTIIVEHDGELVQEVHNDIQFKLDVVDISHIAEQDQYDHFSRLADGDVLIPFDMSKAPLLHVLLVTAGKGQAFLANRVHHSCFDGLSIRIMGYELGVILSALLAGGQPELPQLPLQYGDYASWEKEFHTSVGFEAETKYWQKKLQGMPYFEVPPDRKRALTPRFNGNIVGTFLPEPLIEKLKAATRQQGVSLFAYGAAVLSALLHGLTGESDISFGAQTSGRHEIELENMIGLFINNLVLRFDTSGDPTFTELLKRANGTVGEAITHQNMPFQKLIELINPERDPARAPLVSVNFVLERGFLENKQYEKFELVSLPSGSPGSVYDLNFFIMHRGNKWRMAVEYTSELFDQKTIESFLDLWKKMIEFSVTSPDQPLSSFPITRRFSKGLESDNKDLKAIEKGLSNHPAIKDCVAVMRPDGKDHQRPYAYATPLPDVREPLEALPAKLLAHLSQNLDVEQMPAGVSMLVNLPRDAGGNVLTSELPVVEQFAGGPSSLLSAASASPIEALPAGQSSASPANENIAKLTAIWSDILGVENIGPDDNFFNLGGHSLLIVRMMARVKKEFGVKNLNVALLYESPTLGQLAQFIEEEQSTTAIANAVPSQNWQVVNIQPQGDDTPVIAFNHSILYFQLAKHLADQRAFSNIQLVDIDHKLMLEEKPFEEIVADAVSHIRTKQPRGPYVLFGLCANGTVAIEAAQQLKKAGEEVPLVAICDSWAPPLAMGQPASKRHLKKLLFRIKRLQHNFVRYQKGLTTFKGFLSTYDALIGVMERLGIDNEYKDTPEDIMEGMIIQYLMAGIARYRPETYDGDVIMFRSDHTPRGALFDEKFGWGGLLKGRVDVYDIPGWHEEVFRDPGAKMIAGHIRNALERSGH